MNAPAAIAALPCSVPQLATPSRLLMTVDAVGGVWRYAMELGRGLAELGIHTLFVGLGPGPNAAQRREACAIGELVWLDLPLDWTTTDEAALDRLPARLRELVDRNRIDLVHLNVPSQAAGLALPVPVVAVAHSCVVTWFAAVRGTDLPPEWAWQKRRNRAGFEAARIVVTPSRSHAALIESCYGHIDNLAVVHNATGAPGETADDRGRGVFAAGRWWDAGKNGAALDGAAQDIALPVLMAGPLQGPDGQALSLRHAHALGELPHDEVKALLRRAAMFASPSVYEPFGLAALEAARAGTPLVLADIPTYRELWGGAALFANPRDPAAFASATNRLAHDPSLRRELGRRAQERSQLFTPARQASAMAALYATASAPSLAMAV